MKERIQKQLLESAELKRRLAREHHEAIGAAARHLAQTLGNGGSVLVCGNGGSAADAQHIATELVVRLRKGWKLPPQSVQSLTTNSSLLTACANDFGYEQVFSRQVEGLGRSGDCLIGISTSGNSENVIRAFHTAKEKGMTTLLLGGGDGGKLLPLADLSVVVPSSVTNRIQEGHLAVFHVICDLLEILLLDEE